ncbi:SPAT7-like protein, partial [Mya arenaria]
MKSTSVRGQLGVRSGPLAPTAAKLTTQYLVLDHMNNHYSKISKARPAIDNRPPKSMATSQKARDRKTRDHIQKTGSRPTSTNAARRPHTTTGYYQDDIYDENLWGEPDPEDEESQLIHSIMRTTLRGQQDQYATDLDQNGFDQYSRVPRQRPSSARSQRSMASGVSRTMVQVAKKGTYDGDVLEKHSQVFTEGKPFTPRTIKNDRKSRLSQYKYYNKVPPKSDTTNRKEPVVEETERKEVVVEQSRPKPKPRQPRLDQTREGPVTMNSLMFETLHSRDFSKYDDNENNPGIPKLDISMDTDHIKWVKDQASKAKLRQNNDTLKSTLREDPYDTSVDFGKTGEMSLTFGTLGSTKTRDEEGEYVRFMRDVTNEILDRGIYTDRSVRQVFKAHISRNRGKLDELRLHQITDDIRQQLNIPRYDINDDTSLSMTKIDEPLVNGVDHNLDKYLNMERRAGQRGLADQELEDGGLDGTLETSGVSRASKVSTEPSADTYNFKSTEDDDVYSTIRSDMNNTANLTDTQALRTYQASINEKDEFEEGEIEVRPAVDRAGRGGAELE